MKKSVNVVALLVFVATNVFTPFSYAVDDENQISPTDILISSKISEPLIVDDEENVGGEEKDIGGEETEKPNVSVETQNNEDGDLEGNKLQILEELKEIVIDPLLMLDRTEEEIVDDSEKLTDDDMDEEVIGSREIYGTGEHKNVKVEVYAETGAFEETPILVIEPLESEKETEIKKAILTYNEDTEELDEEEIEEVAEEKIIEVVAFDIKFLDKEENEVQPREGMVKVEFNFTENEILEETEEHEVKVYHLNDKDEEGNTIDEIKDMEIDEPEVTENKEAEEEIAEEENNEEQIVTVVGDKFSIYTIVQQVKEEGPLAENEDQLANFEYGEISIARPDSLSGEYPDIPGITIMDRNLGAIELYNNDNDYPNEESYGYHYQWGNNYGIPLDATSGDVRVPDPLPRNSSYDNSGYYSTGFLVGPIQGFDVWEGGIPHVGVWGGSGDSGDNSWGLSGINYTDRQGPCPEGWHVPSAGEWGLLVKYWAITSGVNYNGGNYTENGLYNLSEGFENFQNYFRLPLGGFRSNQSAVVYDKGNYGHYRSSSPYWSSSYPYSVTTDYFDSYELSLSSSNVNSNYRYVRGNGRSVRCFKDTYTPHNQEDLLTITYVYNGGSGSTAVINVISGEYAIEPEEPIKEGYIFDGWYEFDTFQGNKFSFKETVITGGKTLYAKWILENDVAILKTGREFNTIIKTLASGGNNVNYDEKDENIQYFVRYEGNNLPEYKQKISLEGYRDVYAWYSGNNTIYYHTDVETIYLNEDSSYMFYYLKNLKSLNLDDFSTDYVKDMSSMFSHSFSNIDGLTLDFRNLNLSNVSDMSDMFSYSFNTAEYVKHVKLDFSNQNFNNLKDMRRMFEYSFLNAGIVSGVIIDFSSVNLYSIESMESAFAYSFCGTSFEGISIDFSNLFIGTSINMTEMFYFTFKGGNGLMVKGIIIDFSNGNFSGDVNMTRMINNSFNQGNFSISGILIDFNNINFKSNGNFTSMFATSFSSINGTISFVTIDFSGVHFESNNNMNYMFQSSFGSVSTASSLSVKFDDVYIGGETNMYGMFQSSFYPGGNLVGVNVSFNNANLSGVVDMSYMFSNAFYFNNVVGVELNFTHVDVSNLRNMEYMFHSIGLRELDLMSFDTRNVINMGYLFSSSQNLKTVYVGNNFGTENVTSSSCIFCSATSLVGGNGTRFSYSHTDKTYAHIDTGDNPGYFTDPNNFTVRYLSGDEVVANLTGKVGGTATGLNDGERIYSYYSDSTKNNPYDFEQTLSGYTEIYVSWVDKLALTLDANGGYVSQSEIESDNEGNVTLPNATRGADENGERVFEGWFASTGMSEKIGNSGDVISLTDNMTVYAHWAQTIKIWNPTNPLSGFIIMDRNLGAITTGYGASASTGSYGFKYQWGNNYGFVDGCWTNECSDNVSLSSVMVSDLGAIWKNIYNNSGYFGSTFIKSNSYPFDYWEANEGYDNLWGGANDSSLSNRGANQTNPTDRQGPCPVGYHVPSAGEWGLLIKYWAETKDDGISENATYADSSEGLYNLSSNYSLFQQKFNLPFAGRRDNTDAYLGNYTYGYYWSSSPNSFKSRYLSLNSTSVSMNNDNNRARAYSVRCFKDEYVAPETNNVTFNPNNGDPTTTVQVVSGNTATEPTEPTRTKGTFTGWYTDKALTNKFNFSTLITGNITLYAKWECNDGYAQILGDDGARNCFEYGDLELYLLKSDGNIDYYTIMDRNMGAMEVYNQDYINQNTGSYGYYYVWLNNYGFSLGGSNFIEASYGNGSRDRGPCPTGYHIRSRDEQRNIYSKWKDAKGENKDGKIFASDLLLPFAGYISWLPNYSSMNGKLSGQGSNFVYWSSTQSSSENAYFMYYTSDVGFNYNSKHYGRSVRCVKNLQNQTLTINSDGGTKAVIAFTGTVGNGKFTALGEPIRSNSTFLGWYDFQGNKLETGSTVVSDIYAKWECNPGYAQILGDDGVRNCFEYNELPALIGSDGKKYILMDRNLGARTVWDGTTWTAETDEEYDSDTDVYGYYYQWGNNYGFSANTTTGQEGPVTVNVSDMPSKFASSTWINTSPWNSENNLWGDETDTEEARQGPCPTNWHVPSSGEWQAIYNAWNSRDGKSFSGSISENLAKDLKLPPAGLRLYDYLDFNLRGSIGYYWSSSPYSASNTYHLYFNPSNGGPQNNSDRSRGFPVRCLKNQPKILTLDANGGTPTESEIETDENGNVTLPNAIRESNLNVEWVFEGWFASTGMSEKIGNSGDVISLTDNMTVYAHWAQTITIWDPANPLSGFTIMDRNLGAIMTGAGAGASTGSYGYHYQWGNNYGFDSSKLESILKSGIKVDVSSLSEYSEPIFITGYDTWMDPYKNLWGEGGQGPCPDGWHVPMKEEWSALDIYYKNTYNSGSDGFINYFNLPFSRHLGETAYWSDEIDGRYWSSTQDSTPVFAYALKVLNNNVYPDNIYIHIFGNSVRCFKNEFNAPSMNTITFDAQGGDVETGSISVVSGSTVNLSGYMASMDGWNFTGWNINSGAHEGMDSITVTGDVTLYAIFSKEMTSNFVLRDPNAASLDETTASCTAYNGGYCIVTAPTLTKKSGYTVDGWSADEGNEITTIFTGGNTFNSVTHYDVPVSITFYQNGNGGTGYEVRTCYKYNGAGSCKITSPSISVSEGFIVQGWSDSPDYHGSSWYANSEADKYYDESYYAQAYLPVSVTFLANNNSVDGGSYAERYCTRYNGDKCYVTTPTIASVGSNTPEIVGYTLSADGVSSADIESNSGLYISGRETYYAHTKKSKVTLVAKWDGNNSTLSSYEDSDCELPEVYDGAAQISGCTVSAPVITAPEATPIVIGFNTGENATTNSDSYNTGNGKLFLTEDSHNQTWYAITYMSGKVLTIDYSIGAGVYSIGKNSDSCTLTGTYNGIAQASSCTVKAPTITVNSGYSDTSKKWTDLSTSSQVDEGEDIILTKDLHYTASAQYQSSTIPETYTITYELNGGTISGEKLVYTVEDPTFTLVNPTWEHHIFAGWTGAGISDPQLVVTISQGTKFENLTYYANWYEDFNDNGINDAIESHFLVKYTDGVDGETVFEDQIFNEVLSGLATPLFVGTPERAGYDFLGWSPEVSELVLDDVEYVARWNKQLSGGGNSSGGGGKRLPIVDTHGVADDEKDSLIDENKEAEEKSETEDSQANQQDETKNNDGENSQGESEPDYPDEFVDAYSFSRINGITTVEKIQDAKMYANLTRIEMAKMLSNYAINVLGKKPDTSKTIKFKDVTNKMDKKYDNGVLLSYQLGIMGINVKNKKFRPNDLVTRAEFATALSRTLFGGEEGKYKSTRKYYEPHIAKLYNEGIINNTDPNMKEKRGYVMIMLMRSVGVK